MQSVCVFCGSRSGNKNIFNEEAYHFGRLLAEKNITLIYGGAKVGIMGAVASGTLDHGGKAIGVLPVFFREKEIAHEGLDELILVDSMHERKVRLIEMSDAFAALPGGFGTLDELAEVLTLTQLGKYQKPLGFLNTNGFFDNMLSFFDTMHEDGFIHDMHLKLFRAEKDPELLLEWMQRFEAPAVKRWIK